MQVCVFEDSHWTDLLPLTWLRPPCLLRCGPGSLLDVLRASLPATADLQVWCRPELADLVHRQTGLPVNRPLPTGERVWMLNGAARWTDLREVLACRDDAVFLAPTRRTLAWVTHYDREDTFTPRTLPRRLERLESARGTVLSPAQARLLTSGFELALHVGEEIAEAFGRLPARGARKAAGQVDAGVHLLSPSAVRVEPGARVKPGAVLDAESGPIWIAAGATVGSCAVIQGPAYLGPGSVVHAHARLRGNVAIGPQCKIGGELEAVVFQGLANKQHDGFVGHSVIGEWVNLGAGTITSDLKNTYGPITPPDPLRGTGPGRAREPVGLFAGALVGDHAKLGIGTLLSGGTLIGLAAQVAVTRPPRWVPSFSWLTEQGAERADVRRLEAVFERVLGRRRQTYDHAVRSAVQWAERASRDLEAGLEAAPRGRTRAR